MYTDLFIIINFRLKNWIAAQAEREKEAAERKKKKLERLCQLPKHEFKDEEYDKERSELPQKVVDAVEQGLKVAGTSVAVKRKQETTSVKKKKPKLWYVLINTYKRLHILFASFLSDFYESLISCKT